MLGIDVSDEPLAEARGLAERAGVDVTFEVGDVYSLAEPDDSFDVVHAHQVLQHLTDPVAALREMARVCRPGGVIAVRRRRLRGAGLVPGGRRPRRLARPLPAGAPAQRQRAERRPAAASWAHAAGLRNAVATTSSWCFASPEDREWWGTSWAGRATGVVLRRAGRGVRAGDAASELAEIAKAWLRWAAADDGWLGMLHGELLIRV